MFVYIAALVANWMYFPGSAVAAIVKCMYLCGCYRITKVAIIH